jgi:hypothetical protein
MSCWEGALEVWMTHVGSAVNWMLVGSAASAVQGVIIEPGDVDVLVHPDTLDNDLRTVATALASYASTGPVTHNLDWFLSTSDQPLVATPDGTWLFGRWWIDGCKLEVARIRVDVGLSAIVETMGTAVWETSRTVRWRSHAVPVVPLEVQLATLVARGLDERVRAVRVRTDVSGLDQALLARALADRGVG